MSAHEASLREHAAAQAVETERTRQMQASEELQRSRAEAGQQLTLRDRFAIQAPPPDTGWVARETSEGDYQDKFEIEAAWRYQWADRMIAAREKGSEE